MGAWGYRTYENDHVLDNVPYSFQEYKTPTNSEVDKTLKKVFNPSKIFFTKYQKMETRLGVVVYFLETEYLYRPHIARKYLLYSLAYARKLKKDKKYLADWKGKKARKNRLEKEIKLIREAQNNIL